MNHSQQPLSQTPARRQPPRGFTLMELLVVMGIIVLMVAMALPAFNFITGSRSTEAATNNLAAALGVARTQAIGLQDVRGVAIYRDPDSERSTAVLVELRPTPLAPYTTGAPATPVTYKRGQYVQLANKAYICNATYVDSNPGNGPGVGPNWTSMKSVDAIVAGNINASFVEAQSDAEFIQLPKGIDARGIGNQVQFPDVVAGNPIYRYVNPVVVLFDANGQVLTTPYYIAQEGIIGDPITRAGQTSVLNGFVPPVASNVLPYGRGTAPNNETTFVNSQIGLTAFDSSLFVNGLNGSVLAADQGNWLDQNTSPSMLNRYNGTLVKGD